MKDKLLGILQAVLLALGIVAGAIALPILFRPFFYLHIAPLGLAESAGLTIQQIHTAYNEMMNYCIGLADTFSVGVLTFSVSGAAHFTDVRRLFVLDLWVLGITVVLLIVLFLGRKKKQIFLLGHTPGFWSAAGLGAGFLLLGGLVALDFNKAFQVFHKLFFPGKSNWIFNPKTDPIIKLLPAEFFRNCGILILTIVIICCGLLLLWDRKQRKDKTLSD